uniref:Uncharacterized protein n=1 Tax=Sinocyclocheilus grahami TaxID=75366 RepID=A0A672KCQ9_SINGR
MCTGHCSRSVGMALIPTAIVCMLANALLLFPDLKYQYLTENHVTREAMWCSGIWASGLLVSLSVLWFSLVCRRSDTILYYFDIKCDPGAQEQC